MARSQLLVGAAALLCGLYAVSHAGSGLATWFGRFFREQLGGCPWRAADGQLLADLANDLAGSLGGLLAPIFAAVFLGAVAAHLGQSGILFVPGNLAPHWSRLSPWASLRRWFSLEHGFQLGLGVVQAIAILGVVLASLWSQRHQLFALGNLPPLGLAVMSLSLLEAACIRVAWLLAALGLIDFAWQKWRYERRLRMTPEELREEMRQPSKGGRGEYRSARPPRWR